MFASLLPGLRDLRNPIAAGALWLFALWLCVREQIPTRAEATGLLSGLYDLGDALGAGVLVGALGFVAYLAGVILSLIPNFLMTVTKKSYISLYSARRAGLDAVTNAGRRAIDRGVPARVVQDFIEGRGGFFVTDDMRVVATRLHAADPGIFDDFDRAYAEAEFRFGAAIPTALCGILATVSFVPFSAMTGLGIAVSLIAGVLLLVFAAVRLRESDEILWEAEQAGIIESPTVTALDAMTRPRPSRSSGSA